MKDELQALRTAFAGSPAVSQALFDDLCKDVTTAWQEQLLGDISEDAFGRYLNFHLVEISRLSAATVNNNCENHGYARQGLFSLLDHLQAHYSGYLNLEIAAPRAYAEKYINRIISEIRSNADCRGNIYGNWVFKYLLSAGKDDYTFRQLAYLEKLSRNVFNDQLDEDAQLLWLISVNFNHLGFYQYLTAVLAGSSMEQLSRLHRRIKTCPERTDAGFDPLWISLKVMACGWLEEELAALEQAIPAGVPRKKVYLNVSVAQLACFVRLAYEQNIMQADSLTDLFRGICESFRTKRQMDISEGSFSKEFYGIGQQTAARVDGALQQMRAKLKQKYFPLLAWIVVNAALCFPAGN